MKIVVEPSDYILRNIGDMAMMHVAITRLTALWPHAFIQVLTNVPELLSALWPNAIPIVAGQAPPDLAKGFPFLSRLSRVLMNVGGEICRGSPFLVGVPKRLRARALRSEAQYGADVLNAIAAADFMVVCGMGGLTDVFAEYAFGLLERMELALNADVPVVMLGQGIGPLTNPELREKAKSVLPRVIFIALREGRSSGPLLRSLGVSETRVATTGDDAIEIAFRSRAGQLGKCLGVNLRAANYAGIDHRMVAQFGRVVRETARTYNVPMLPVPISRVLGEEDAKTIKKLLAGFDDASDGGAALDTLTRVIEQIKSCRIVIAGSYHAAALALSMGIPAIGIANSAYYADKFLGLSDQFGIGCELVAVGPKWTSRVSAALERAWRTAEDVRPRLLAAAEQQIALGHAAYRRVYDLVASLE